MASNVLSFVYRSSAPQPGWTNAELAELYRVENALLQARILVETDLGTTDEGDPWFVFCRPDGEVIVHATRFGGVYRLYSSALPEPLTGPSFSTLTKTFVSGLRIPVQTGGTVCIHPSALLTLLVAAIFYSIDFHSGKASAEEHAAVADQNSASVETSKGTVFQTLVAHITAVFDPSKIHATSVFAAFETAAIVAAVAYIVSGYSNSDGQNETQIEVAAGEGHIPLSSSDDHAPTEYVLDGRDGRIGIADAANLTASAELSADEPQSHQETQGLNRLVLLEDNGRNSAFAGILIDGSKEGVAVDENPVIKGTTATAAFERLQVVLDDRQASGDKLVELASDSSLMVLLTNGSFDIDVSDISGARQILISGEGEVRVTGLTAAANPEFIFSAGSIQLVSLSFGQFSSTSSVSIRLEGQDQLTLTGVVAENGPVHITIDSDGDAANHVVISDDAIESAEMLNLRIIGIQDLVLRETVAAFRKTALDVSGLGGSLTLGLDFHDEDHTVDLSQVNAANFIVGNNGVASLQTASGSNIQLSSDLNVVDIAVAEASAGGPGKLSLNLQSEITSDPITVQLLEVFNAPNLALNTSHAGPGLNTIDNLADADLSLLTITGDSGLAINSITGLSNGDGRTVTIDAHALTGSLSLNVSDLSDMAGAGRSYVIIGGAATNVLTNMTNSDSTSFVAGGGHNVVNISGGALNDSISNLKSTDVVNIGSASHSDILINALVDGSQVAIESQANLTAAAQLASDLISSNVTHQALLFAYQGNVYVFIDAAGNHAFDSNHDAIIKLVGVPASVDLTGVFHSA